MKFDGVSKNGDHNLEDSVEYTRIEYGYYLMAVSHRIMGLPGNVMNQDMSILMNVKDVGRLSVEERGDVCIMLADLASDGFKANKKLKKSEIKELYRIGMDSGNEYARDKYIQMK